MQSSPFQNCPLQTYNTLIDLMALGLKLLLGYRRDQGLVLKVSDNDFHLKEKANSEFAVKYRFCPHLFLYRNIYRLKDTLDKRRFLER